MKKKEKHKPQQDITMLRGNKVRRLKQPYTPEQAKKIRDLS